MDKNIQKKGVGSAPYTISNKAYLKSKTYLEINSTNFSIC
ncbi:Uncharacterised protein [Sphingobacterium daejeonense]|nr:Uncharacterised protein [Sphingobacterium daejeonense]